MDYAYDEFSALTGDDGDDNKVRRMSKGENVPIENESEIDEILLFIKKYDENLNFLKQVKKRRIEAIDSKISYINDCKQNLRDCLLLFMQNSNQKTYDIPDLAKIQYKVPKKGNWEIKNEDALLNHLRDNGVEEECTEIKLIKSKVKKILDSLEQADNLDDSVERLDPKPSIAISFYEDSSDKYFEHQEEKQENINNDIDNQYKKISKEDFDNIEI